MRFSLFGVALTLSIILSYPSSCAGSSDLQMRFDAERLLNKADRLQDQAALKGPLFSDPDFLELVDSYKKVIELVGKPVSPAKFANSSDERKLAWGLGMLAETRIGSLYLGRRKYDRAFEHFKSVSDNPAADQLQRNAITYYLAISKEQNREYLEAANFYDSLAAGYWNLISADRPNLDALDAPLKKAEMKLISGDIGGFATDSDIARQFYDSLLRRFPNSQTAKAVTGKIIASYLKQGQFLNAIEIMKTVRDESTGKVSPSMMIMIAETCMSNLKDFKHAELMYRDFIASYPASSVLGSAYLGLVLSLFEQEKYADARVTIKIMEKSPNTTEQNLAEAYYLTALCYEREGKWEMARGQLDQIQAMFPGSDKAFEAAIYIGSYYLIRGQDEFSVKAFKDAEHYIKKYIYPETANPLFTSRALGYLVKCYLEQNEFNKAIEILRSLNGQYRQYPDGKLASLKLADIYENIVSDTTQATSWLKTYIHDNPLDLNIAEVEAHIRMLE